MWTDYYPYASNIKFAEPGQPGDGKPFKEGLQFTWTTFRVEFLATVKECVPNRRIRWQGKPTNHLMKNGGGETNYWTFYDLGNGNVRVVCEESEKGTWVIK